MKTSGKIFTSAVVDSVAEARPEDAAVVVAAVPVRVARLVLADVVGFIGPVGAILLAVAEPLKFGQHLFYQIKMALANHIMDVSRLGEGLFSDIV